MASSPGDSTGAAATNLPLMSTSAPAKLSFFDIPSEVRLEIYELLYCYPKNIHLALDDDGNVKHWRNYPVKCHLACEPTIPVHAFMAGKKFYQEAAPVLYQRNKFRMEWENLNKFFRQWDQTFSSLLPAIDILCASGPMWGFVPAIRGLGDKMPGLCEINLQFDSSCRLVAAALETSNAITPCASMFSGPDLELVVLPVEHDCHDKYGVKPDVDAFINTIRQQNSKLADFWPQDLPADNITRFNAPSLSVVRLSGEISTGLLAKIEQHKCLPGDCFWMKVCQEVEKEDADNMTREKENSGHLAQDWVHYKWKAMDPRERTDLPKVDMRQWYPPLTEKEKQKVRDFAKAFEKRDDACQDDESPSGEHETATEKDESASEANAPHKDDADDIATMGCEAVGDPRLSAAEKEKDTSSATVNDSGVWKGRGGFADDDEKQAVSTKHELTDQCATSEHALPPSAVNEDIKSSEETEPASTESGSPEEHLQDLQELAFANWFEEVNSEYMHKDPEEVKAAWRLQLGPLASLYLD